MYLYAHVAVSWLSGLVQSIWSLRASTLDWKTEHSGPGLEGRVTVSAKSTVFVSDLLLLSHEEALANTSSIYGRNTSQLWLCVPFVGWFLRMRSDRRAPQYFFDYVKVATLPPGPNVEGVLPMRPIRPSQRLLHPAPVVAPPAYSNEPPPSYSESVSLELALSASDYVIEAGGVDNSTGTSDTTPFLTAKTLSL